MTERRREPPENAPPVPPRPVPALVPARSAVLDEAHLGDIEGALGRIRVDDDGSRRGLRRKLITFLAIMGPGLIVMVGDNDAGGVSTYAQAGQNYGYSLLWVLLLLIPVLIVNQEMVVRLGAVTGVGHARLINERFGRFWGWFSVGDLFLLNFLTIVTEFIGVSLALRYFGITPYISVPLTAVLLVGITASGSFARWERAIFLFIATSLVLYPLALASHPLLGPDRLPPGGAVASRGAPAPPRSCSSSRSWAPRWRPGSCSSSSPTSSTSASRPGSSATSGPTPRSAPSSWWSGPSRSWWWPCSRSAARTWSVTSPTRSGWPARWSSHAYWYGALFAIVLLDASIIGASAVTLSTSYAFGDVFGLKHSLHRSFRDAKQFYLSYTVLVVMAAGIVLIPHAPLGLITTSVQALAGVLLPSASVFLLLLCNDPEVLGPWVNPRWLNILATIIIGVLLTLSGTLVVSTVFPGLNVAGVAGALAVALVVAGGGAGLWLERLQRSGRRPRPLPVQMSEQERRSWRMPPLALLQPVDWSPGIKLGVLLLRGYLVVSVALLAVKAVQLGGG